MSVLRRDYATRGKRSDLGVTLFAPCITVGFGPVSYRPLPPGWPSGDLHSHPRVTDHGSDLTVTSSLSYGTATGPECDMTATRH